MGLFRRRESVEEAGDATLASPAPIDTSSVDLDRADAVLSELASAVGSTQLMRAALPRLVMASGCPHPDDDLVQYAALQEDPFMPTRVWRWILATMLRANEAGRYEISAKGLFWAFVWDSTIAPTIEGSSFLQLGFDRAPRDTFRELMAAGNIALTHLPDDLVVVRTAEPKVITVRWLQSGDS